MKLFVFGALLLAAACASAPVQQAPLIARKEGLTITIRNPFDCGIEAPMQCAQVSGLDYECVCVSVAARETRPASQPY